MIFRFILVYVLISLLFIFTINLYNKYRTTLSYESVGIVTTYDINYFKCKHLKIYSKNTCILNGLYKVIIKYDVYSIKKSLIKDKKEFILNKDNYTQEDYKELIDYFINRNIISLPEAKMKCNIVANFINLTEQNDYCNYE